MTKLFLAMMCVSLSVAALAGCSTSTMPSPDDPSTAIHEDPALSQGPSQSSPTVAAAASQHKVLTDSATAAK